jgi:hypothetical protein
MSSEKCSDLTIDDVLTPSSEIIENGGLVTSQINILDVDSDSQQLESDAKRFFARTHLTDALEDSLIRLRDSLQGEEIQPAPRYIRPIRGWEISSSCGTLSLFQLF